MQVAALEMAFKQIGADAVAAAMGKLSKSFDEATAEGKKTDAMMGKLTDAAKKLVAGFAVGATMKKFIDATADAQNVQAQLAAGLRSTGFASGQTVEALNAQAEALMRLSTFDDEAIGGAQSLLLTFTKISGDTFPKATQAVLNMATRMGGDLQGAAIQVGKALQDPIAGVTALGRAGVQFTDAQKAVIAEMVETNRLAEAQRVVLAELETQFGGSAEAARNTLGGAVQYLKNQFDNLFELNPGQAAPIITSINALADALQPIATLINGLIVSIVGGGATMVKALNNIFLAFLRVVNRVVQFLSEVGGVVVKVLAMFTGNLTAEFDRSVNNWLKGFDYTEEALIEQQNEWKAWENDIYESLAGVRRETAKPIAPPPVSGAAGGGVGGSRLNPMPTDRDSEGNLLRSADRPGTPKGLIRYGQWAQMGKQIPQLMAPILTDAERAATDMAKQIETTFAVSISAALTSGIVAGIENAIATGNISEGFKALTTVILSGFGDAMIQFGVASLAASELMTAIQNSLASFLPGGAIAASLAMIALGATLKGTARASFGGGKGSRGGTSFSTMSFGGGIGTGPTQQIIFGSTSAATAAGMTPRSATNVTIIGPNDPSAQRAMQELMAKADSRGRLG